MNTNLDSIVAEKITGWTLVELHPGLKDGPKAWKDASGSYIYDHTTWRPSTNVHMAHDVRVKMTKLGWSSEDRLTDMGWGLNNDGTPKYGYSFWFKKWMKDEYRGIELVGHSHSEDTNKTCATICRAALMAINEEENLRKGTADEWIRGCRKSKVT